MDNRLRILDTDILSNWDRGSGRIESYIKSIPSDLRATTIITIEQQLGGRLKWLKECYDKLLDKKRKNANVDESISKLVSAYVYLHETLKFLCGLKLKILPFNEDAARQFVELKSQVTKKKAKDLQIAAIAISVDGVVVTGNRRDFEDVPGLDIEDWTKEMPGLKSVTFSPPES